ncbi:MAG: 2-oxoglutarate dehydrogenase E1 component [Burkholderiales bacterium]|jgi:2-oxoglutarate dehydrogenase E1 component|nr:2-oxoglutarate dehydrogenase E1 component [Burkholderiales bacterium]
MMKQMLANSYLFGGNAPFVEELYEAYLANPQSVSDEWRDYFDKLQLLPTAGGEVGAGRDVAHAPIVESFAQRAKQGLLRSHAPVTEPGIERKQVYVLFLITAHRTLGVRWADLDPLKRTPRPQIPELEPAYYDLTEADMELVFNTGTLVGVPERATLREILHHLRETYTGSIGAEYMYMSDPAQKRWIQQRLEGARGRANLTPELKHRVLERLTAAETLEKYLHTRYVGQKRFSLEGSETLIASMDEIVRRAGTQGVEELVIGMAHRGRLNVLVNTLGKAPKDLFSEFEGKAVSELSSGDVKYHNGFSSDVSTPGGPVHLTLAFNPSHLEIVNPVVEGSVRARQHRRKDTTGDKVMSLLIHGDAAFAGQGVVMETLNLAQTRGYGTGGSVHVIVNNQIGFTTSDPRDTRSTLYCTDVAKMIEAPIFHVNSDDPEAVIFVTQLAMDFRKEFKKDVVIDIISFRRHGHNEQDEPFVTQPLMYRKITQHPGTRKLYADKLLAEGAIAEGEAERLVKDFRQALDEGRHTSSPVLSNFQRKYAVDWTPFLNAKWTDAADTSVPMAELQHLGGRLTTVPEGFKLHPSVERVMQARREMAQGRKLLDWGMAESLAYASLLVSGYGVRISGQDCGRGTFAHRHSVLHDQAREKWDAGSYTPLQHVSDTQADFMVIDSVLSEEAVLGFEYGYSCAEPNELVVWEAQFGDFANGAQVVIDQFITSGEAKWGRMCGLVMLLPHGYEGQGPEHSSARLERYLQLTAEHNIQVCVPSTPAQIFHLLRRQMVRPFRKPLVVMTPKSLLRKPDAASSLKELAKGGFQTVIGEIDALEPDQVTRVVACSGKVYYDLVTARRERRADHVAIIRIEQLYPFPHKQFAAEMKRYAKAKEVVWAQEEPQNQGAWYQIQHYMQENMRPDQKLHYAGRPSSASPAVGYVAKHNEQQKKLVEQALGKLK